MEACFIRKLSENTLVFTCNPPMKFLKEPRNGKPGAPEFTESGLIVTWFGEIADGYKRVVIHSAAVLAGEDGIGYPICGSRVFDADITGVDAIELTGYAVKFPNQDT